MMRAFVVNRLYDLANVLCIAADRLSPADDSVWRARMWSAYGVTAKPDELGNLASEHNPTHTDYVPMTAEDLGYNPCEYGSADD
jgi:hypothetical protein